MSIADRIRIILGNLTEGERAERDAAARRRIAAADKVVTDAAEAARQQAAAEAAYAQAGATHHRRIDLAAGISTLRLFCHKDTWDNVKLAMQIGRYSGGFASSPDYWDGSYSQLAAATDGLIVVTLSGPHVAEVLDRTGWLAGIAGSTRIGQMVRQSWSETTASRAVFRQVYRALAEVVDQVDPNNPSGEVPDAVISAGVAARAEEEVS